MILAEVQRFEFVLPINPMLIVGVLVGIGMIALALTLRFGLPLLPTKRRKTKRRT